MSECRRTDEQLPRYVDDALDEAEHAKIDRHLQKCPPCRDAAVQEGGGRAVLRERASQLRTAPLPPGLRTRCEELARRHGQHTSLRMGWLAPAAVAALLVVVTVVTIVVLATQQSNVVLAAQLTADHALCFSRFPPGTNSVDAVQTEEMLASRYGWDVHVPPSSEANGLRLVGARRCLYADGRIPHVLYRAHDQNVSLFILEGVERGDADVTALGHRARVWSRGPNTFVLVTSAAGGDLASVVRYVKQEAH